MTIRTKYLGEEQKGCWIPCTELLLPPLWVKVITLTYGESACRNELVKVYSVAEQAMVKQWKVNDGCIKFWTPWPDIITESSDYDN